MYSQFALVHLRRNREVLESYGIEVEYVSLLPWVSLHQVLLSSSPFSFLCFYFAFLLSFLLSQRGQAILSTIYPSDNPFSQIPPRVSGGYKPPDRYADTKPHAISSLHALHLITHQ